MALESPAPEAATTEEETFDVDDKTSFSSSSSSSSSQSIVLAWLDHDVQLSKTMPSTSTGVSNFSRRKERGGEVAVGEEDEDGGAREGSLFPSSSSVSFEAATAGEGGEKRGEAQTAESDVSSFFCGDEALSSSCTCFFSSCFFFSEGTRVVATASPPPSPQPLATAASFGEERINSTAILQIFPPAKLAAAPIFSRTVAFSPS